MRPRDLIPPVLLAVVIVAAPALIGFFGDACPTEDHDDWSDALGEIQEIMDGELARGQRMESMARDIRRMRQSNEGFTYALNAEAR